MESLHPGAKWLFRFKSYGFLLVLTVFVGLIIGPVIYSLSITFLSGIGAFLILTLILLSFFIFISELFARLSYKFWKFDVGSSVFKSERGIIWKRYTSIPYERVQNVDIHRGILARMLGFSTVMIQTAGMSYHPRAGRISEGYIPAVSIQRAEKIRDTLTKKISGKKSSI